jgi:hypothetical protein
LLLAGCDPASHPFATDRPDPDAPILQVKDGVGVVVTGIDGVPVTVADPLADAMADALRDLEIPATKGGGNRHSFKLTGSGSATASADGSTALAIRWTIRDAAGTEIGHDDQVARLASTRWEAGDPSAMTELARAEAGKLLPMVTEPPPVERKTGRNVFVREVSGAPGDGSRALASALGYLLKGRGVKLTEDVHDQDAIVVAGEVAVSPAAAPQAQHVKITWHVLQPDGTDLAQIGQENDVPKGSLDGRWGQTAMAVAMAGLDDIMRIVKAAATG